MSEAVSASSPALPSGPPASAEAPAILLLSPSGRVAAASASAGALWQASEEELVGEAFAALFVFEVISREPDAQQAQWEAILAAGCGVPLALHLPPRGSPPRPVRVRLEKALGGPAGYFALVGGAEPAVPPPAADAAFALLAEKGAVGFFDLNFKERRFHFSAAWKRLLGYAAAELPDSEETWRTLIHPDDSSAAPDQLGRRAGEGATPFAVEFRMRHRLGHDVWIQSAGLQIAGADGALERVLGIHCDIGERKEIEEAGLANEERFKALTDDTGPTGAFELDFIRRRFWFSPAWRRLFGHGAPTGADGPELLLAALPAAEAEAGVEAYFLGRATGQATFVELARWRDRAGRPRPVLLGVHRTLTRRRELARVIGFCCALPDALAPAAGPAEEFLPDAMLGAAFAALAEGVLLTDRKGRILYVNATAARLLRIAPEKARGQAAADLFRLVHRQTGRPVDDVVAAALAADEPPVLTSEHALAVDGAAPLPVAWTARAAVDAAGQACGVAVVFRNPEEMRLTPDELVKANRFESLGLLAGGIAHDFNNLLAPILGGVSVAKDNRDYSALEDVEKACLAAKGLARQLLAIAKGGSGTEVVVAPKDLLEEAAKIGAAGSSVAVSVEVPEGVEAVRVDRGRMLQVFQNLVMNAVQAMPPAPHQGRIQLGAANVTLEADQIPALPAGPYVQFEARDNGAGIPAEILEKIWDPFFTTKKHGTGLGLATVLSIVRKHGGMVGVASGAGVGTTFTLFLPVADRPAEVQARRAASLRFGTGRVLFMDDDPKITALTATMLESLEYKFDLARNGEEAIALYQRYLNIGRPYDAVIMDLTVVGGMGGEACFEELRRLDPDVRAILSTGYDNDDMARRFLDQGFCGYLTKPYRVTELGQVLKAVLG